MAFGAALVVAVVPFLEQMRKHVGQPPQLLPACSALASPSHFHSPDPRGVQQLMILSNCTTVVVDPDCSVLGTPVDDVFVTSPAPQQRTDSI